jgi:N-methylhydantoinase B
MDNTRFAPWGVKGGHAGRTGHWVVNPETPDARVLAPIGDGMHLKKGDVLRMVTNGGGGWGHPYDREPERVLRDVLDGFVGLTSAREDYGVVIDPDTMALDASATSALRARRPERPLFDRGPGYAEHQRRLAAGLVAE